MKKGLSSSRAGRRAGITLAMVVLLVAAGAGSAAAARRRVGVSLAGPHATGVHEAIAAALKRHGFEATSADVSGDSADAIAAAAKQDRLAAVVLGEVREGGKRLKLRVYGSGGDLIGEGSWAEGAGIKKLEAAVERTLWARVGGALSKARPPGAERAAKGEKAEENDQGEAAATGAGNAEAPETAEAAPASSSDEGEASAPRKRKKKRHAVVDEDEEAGPEAPAGEALDLWVGPRFVARSLTWTPQVPTLRGYSLGYAPALGIAGAWYPAAHTRGGWISNLGVAASIEYTPGLESQDASGTRYPTNESDYWAGLRGRLLFGITQASLTLAGGQQTFIFHSKGTALRSNLADLPDVQYTYGRLGVDVRVVLPVGLTFMAGAGYRYVLNAGTDNYLIQANMYFPQSTLVAFDANAAVGYEILPFLEARAGFDLRRYQMTAGSNGYMVTAAGDQYLAFSVGLAVLLGGHGAGEGGPRAAPPPPAPTPAAEKSDQGGDEEGDQGDRKGASKGDGDE